MVNLNYVSSFLITGYKDLHWHVKISFDCPWTESITLVSYMCTNLVPLSYTHIQQYRKPSYHWTMKHSYHGTMKHSYHWTMNASILLHSYIMCTWYVCSGFCNDTFANNLLSCAWMSGREAAPFSHCGKEMQRSQALAVVNRVQVGPWSTDHGIMMNLYMCIFSYCQCITT